MDLQVGWEERGVDGDGEGDGGGKDGEGGEGSATTGGLYGSKPAASHDRTSKVKRRASTIYHPTNNSNEKAEIERRNR